MKKSTFLLIVVIIATLVGGMMTFMPNNAAESFGLTGNLENSVLFRWLGVGILASALLIFLLRKSNDSHTLKAVFIFTLIWHALSLIVDFVGISQGVLVISKLLPGMIAHSFISVGSIIYLMKLKP